MTDQIVQSLLEAYKQKVRNREGSTHHLLTDPLFTSLPLDKQVEVVQTNAANLIDRDNAPKLHRILGKALAQGMTTGAFATIPAMILMKSWPGRAAVAIAGAGGGAGISSIGAISSYFKEKNRFETTNKYLIHLANKRDDVPTAVKVLDMNRKYEPLTLSRILKNWGSPETPIIDKIVPLGTKSVAEKLKPIEQEVFFNAGS